MHEFISDCDMCSGGKFRQLPSEDGDNGLFFSECLNCGWTLVTYGDNSEDIIE
jgi:predicted  nucleic acid-binding Zn-ribbon protein